MRAHQQAQKIASSPAKKKAKAHPKPQLTIVITAEPDCCKLCGGVIKRFDDEIFLLNGCCAPCHEALEYE